MYQALYSILVIDSQNTITISSLLCIKMSFHIISFLINCLTINIRWCLYVLRAMDITDMFNYFGPLT